MLLSLPVMVAGCLYLKAVITQWLYYEWCRTVQLK